MDDSSDAFSDVFAEMHHTKYTFHKSKAVGLAKTFTRIITVEIVEIFQNKNILYFSDAKKSLVI